MKNPANLIAKVFVLSALIHYGIYLSNDINTSFNQMLFIMACLGISLITIEITN